MMPTAFSINVPSKTANAAAPAATSTTKPQLLGLLQTLPHSVTTFSVSPVPFHALQDSLLQDAEHHYKAFSKFSPMLGSPPRHISEHLPFLIAPAKQCLSFS